MSTMMGNAESSCNWPEIYKSIKQAHDAAYAVIDEAIKLEEEENPREAIEKYKTGISMIDHALNIQIECPSEPDVSWEKARVMIQKMKKTRGEVLTRISCIQNKEEFEPPAPPPTYDEAMSSSLSSSSDQPRTYSELAAALEGLKLNDTNGHVQIIFSHENCKVYFISPDGSVSSYSDLQTLKIGTVEGLVSDGTTTFLQIGEWIYPLVPGVSPCYRTEYGAFILPDLHSDVPGASVGIMLPPDVDAHVYDLLEDILHGIVREEIPEVPLAPQRRRAVRMPDTISHGIVTGAYYIQQGLIKGAEKAGDLLNYSTPKLINHLEPAREEKPISPKVQKGFAIAKDVTSAAVGVTGFIAGKVGAATMALGRYLAPHIKKQGTRLLTTGFHMTENEASDKMNGVLTVAAGAVEGFATVYKGLETSASILGQNLTNNTVKVVEHKYGRPSGIVAGNALYTVGNVVNVSHNINYITPKGIAKYTVKQTGKAMVEDIRHDLHGPSTSGTNLYPNVRHLHDSTSSSSLSSLSSLPSYPEKK